MSLHRLNSNSLRSQVKVVALCLTALGTVVAGASTPLTALACSCAEQSIEQAFAQSAGVFVGKVVLKKKSRDSGGNVERPFDYVFEVTRKFKGIEQGYVAMRVTPDSGANCGYEFKLGRSYVVWAYGNGNFSLGTSSCSRTAPLENARQDVDWLSRNARP